jgi:hypothetical protein
MRVTARPIASRVYSRLLRLTPGVSITPSIVARGFTDAVVTLSAPPRPYM